MKISVALLGYEGHKDSEVAPVAPAPVPYRRSLLSEGRIGLSLQPGTQAEGVWL